MAEPTIGGALRRTPLYAQHQALKAKLVPFAGFEMPVQYTGVIEEHQATRSAAGLFDVSHMGEFEVLGPDAGIFLDRVVPSRASALAVGKVIYTVLTTPRGTLIDDLLIYRLADERFLTVVNAANRDKDFNWMRDHLTGLRATLEDRSDATALIALQGPQARRLMAQLAGGFDAMAVKYYQVGHGTVAGRPCMASRTGYTGELGFEIFLANDDAAVVWDALLHAGAPLGLRPCGLAARDTLRLEAALPLYGNDIDDTTTVLAAGLEFTIDWSKDDFVGKAALAAEQAAGGPARRRVGFEIVGPGIPRQHNLVFAAGREVGTVTSGSFAPTLQKGLGMAYVDRALTAEGTALEIDVRGRRLPAVVVALPFYRRPANKAHS